jgi:Zn-dependent protease
VDESFGIAIFSLIVFLFSTVCHEAAHAVAALRLGDQTAYHNGQVTLNPWPHIRQEPFGLGVLPIISMFLNLQSGMPGVIGFASAPYDPMWAMRNPKRAAWMAMAGPAANFALALIAAALALMGASLTLSLLQQASELMATAGATDAGLAANAPRAPFLACRGA